MLSTGAGARGGSEGSSDKDLDPRVLPVSRTVWGQGFMWAAPGSSAHSFPSPLPRRRLRALHQEEGIMVEHLTLLSFPFA